MLTREDNDLITQVGPGTPMGNMLRQYWMPAAMSIELPAPDSPPLRVRLLGENLIMFRVSSGDLGLIADACPHRGASMFFGRNEEEGLRCVYHGWKFDTAGNCVDMPSEPPESNFKGKVHAIAYRVKERNGLIWAYMGPREVPPPLPNLESNLMPVEQVNISAYFSQCNWLQSLEGDYDTVHLEFLHRGAVQPSEVPPGSFDYYILSSKWGRFIAKDTEFGCTYGCNGPAEADTTMWRIAHFLFPFYAMPPATTPLGSHPHFLAVVPVDDEHCMRWSITEKSQYGGNSTITPVLSMFNGVSTGYVSDTDHNTSDWLGRFRPAGNRQNDYLIDRDAQKAKRGGIGFTGIPGRGQDGSVTESMGVIYGRNAEHLGVTDSGIIRMRRLLIKHARALRDEGTLPPALDNPDAYRMRSGAIVLPNGINGIEATYDLQKKGTTEAQAPQVEARG